MGRRRAFVRPVPHRFSLRLRGSSMGAGSCSLLKPVTALTPIAAGKRWHFLRFSSTLRNCTSGIFSGTYFHKVTKTFLRLGCLSDVRFSLVATFFPLVIEHWFLMIFVCMWASPKGHECKWLIQVHPSRFGVPPYESVRVAVELYTMYRYNLIIRCLLIIRYL